MPAITFILLCVFFFLHHTIAAPAAATNDTTAAAAAAAAAAARCRSISPTTAGPDPTCWNALNMTGWITDWNASPQACAQYEPWGNCFMRLTNNGAAGIDCLKIRSPDACPLPVVGNITQGPAEIWYGAWSIYFLHEYMTKLWQLDYPGYINRKLGWAANIPSVVAFLDSNEPAWSNDTELHRLDRKVAKMMNETWNSPVYDEHKDSVEPNYDRILYQALRNFTDGYGHFLYLASDGGLLHSPL